MRVNPILLVAALLPAACAPSDGLEETAPPEPTATCEAGFFDDLKGEPIEVIDTLNTPLRTRVLGPDDFVPRDFDPNRLTFTTSPDGTVSRIFCG